MLINSDDIKTAKEYLEIMQAFIDGKEIEAKPDSYKGIWSQTTTPIWNFREYKYRIKPLEPEVFIYPIYKRLKNQKETIVEFTGLDSGIYVSTHAKSMYRPGYPALDMVPHTDSSWEDCTVSEDAEKIILNKSNTIELFEVISYCDITEEYSIRKQLCKDEELEELQHYQKTGRSFIIDKDTRKLIKVNHN